MKAVRRQKKEEKAAAIEEVPVPAPGDREVLLRVDCCGVCGSDLHAWLNHPGYEFVAERVTFGHEVSGVVERCGNGVTDWKEGDSASIVSIQGCLKPDCAYCSEGFTQLSVTATWARVSISRWKIWKFEAAAIS